jgi:hypothetical protein
MPEDDGQHPEDRHMKVTPGLVWWLRQTLLTGISCFFFCFGIALLMAAYRLRDPFSFIMTFFGASLMTLISIVMAVGFVLRMWRVRRPERSMDDPEEAP